jgi:hypothetical protein
VIALIAAVMMMAADAAPTPVDTAPNPANATPIPVNTSPNPDDTIVLDGTVVSVVHMKDLFNAFQLARTSDKIDIHILSKPASAMPNGALWHYAGSKGSDKRVDSWVWINKAATDVSKPDEKGIAAGMAAGIILAVMDSGFAGPFWKQFYDTEARKDAAEAAQGGDAFAHRDAVAQRIGNAMISH